MMFDAPLLLFLAPVLGLALELLLASTLVVRVP